MQVHGSMEQDINQIAWNVDAAVKIVWNMLSVWQRAPGQK